MLIARKASFLIRLIEAQTIEQSVRIGPTLVCAQIGLNKKEEEEEEREKNKVPACPLFPYQTIHLLHRLYRN